MGKKIIEQQADTMENYILKLINRCDDKINDKDSSHDSFQYYSGAKDFLYMILSGHSNSLANPTKK